MTRKRPVGANIRPTLKSLFPNGDESYLSILVKLFEQDIVHIVICNDRLAENGKMWKKTSELIRGTELEFTLGTIKKEDFRVLKAADILGSENGDQSIVCVKSQDEYMHVIGDLIRDYNETMQLAKTLEDSGVLPESINTISDGMEQVGNTGVGTYTPQSEEEISFMYN